MVKINYYKCKKCGKELTTSRETIRGVCDRCYAIQKVKEKHAKLN